MTWRMFNNVYIPQLCYFMGVEMHIINEFVSYCFEYGVVVNVFGSPKRVWEKLQIFVHLIFSKIKTNYK